MHASTWKIYSLNDLRNYVIRILCDVEQLELDAFRITERRLVRSGKPCGIYFCLHGPRQVKFSAIWETDHNTVLFYNASGVRFQRVKLACAPRLSAAAV